MSVTIWSLNCQGLNNLVKKNALHSIVFNFRPDIICLQETNIDLSKHDSLVLPQYQSVYNPSTTLGSGTIILLKSDYHKHSVGQGQTSIC